jgi:DNA-binding MarR family transcriptional regulator
MDDPSRLIGSALARLIAAGIRQRRALAKCLEAQTADVLALDYVVTGAESSPGGLARALLLSPSGTTNLIDRLIRAGLISRAPSSGRQRVALTATDAGRELHARTLARMSYDVEHLIEDLPRSHRVLLEQFLTQVGDLAEREADELTARAEENARAAATMPPPVLWG